MEIGKLSGISPTIQTDRVKSSTSVKTGEQKSVSSSSDVVAISTAEPPLDTTKLDAIKAQIESGSYQPDSKAIAKSIIKNG